MLSQTKRATEIVKERQVKEQRCRYKYYQPVNQGWLWDDYCAMCAKAHINLVPLWISRDNLPNATYCFNGNIILTKYDIEHLDRGSILALLGHEVGHDKRYTCFHFHQVEAKVFKSALVQVVLMMVVALAASAMYLYLGHGLPLVLFTATIGLLILEKGSADCIHQHREMQADIWSAYLVGTDNVLHLFKQMMAYERSEQIMILKSICGLYLTPFACARCIVKYIHYRLMLFNRSIYLNCYPSYHRRIKHLLNIENKELK